MQRVRFSVIIVCLNAGEKLHKTVESIQRQSCTDYEILIKDGGSTDGSLTPYLKGAGSLFAPDGRPEEGSRPGSDGRAEEGGRPDPDERPEESGRPGSDGKPEEDSRPGSDGRTEAGQSGVWVVGDGKPARPRLRVCMKKDRGIYDAMNQAVQLAEGEYFFFLNCGDYLYDDEVLRKVSEAMDREGRDVGTQGGGTSLSTVFYGNLFQRNLGTEVCSYREITPFTCYRNVPCHQTCFYHRSLFEERAYDLQYPVRADYEHFLYCYFTRKAKMTWLPLTVCSYEGAGFSETGEHLRAAKAEHREIVGKYLSRGQVLKYRLFLLLTLQPLRTFAANNRALSGIYNKVKAVVYKR